MKTPSAGPVPFVRTPDANFDGLEGFPFGPVHFLQDTHGERIAEIVLHRGR